MSPILEGFPKQFRQNIEDVEQQAGSEKIEGNPVLQSYLNAQKILEEGRKKSKYQFEILPDGKERIFSPEHGEFFIECIRDPNSPKIQTIIDLMTEFDPKESDPDMVAKNVRDENYGYYLLEDNKGEAIAWSQSVLINFLPPDQVEGQPPKAVIFTGHIFTKEDKRRKGLAYEMMQTTFREFAERARSQNRNLLGTISECVPNSEKFWNSLGCKRLYFEDKNGDYKEVSYLQPPLEWYDKENGIPLNPETGEPSSIEECSVHEHLMANIFDGRQKIHAEDLMKMVRTIYEDNYEGKEFDGDREWPAIQAELKKIQDDLENQISESRDGKLQLLSAEERQRLEEALRQKGKALYNLITKAEKTDAV